ncbi:MAG: alpha/beta fold hydrolase [Cuniculiplasma sp.]
MVALMNSLFVEEYGNKEFPPLLYIHGGPGTGSYDFTLHQKNLLSDQLRLISFDQRGVLRSAAIDEKHSLKLSDLINDIEDIRKEKGISKWSVLGHSFGGHLAFLYATSYPDRVNKMIFENAGFDFGLSMRSILKGMAIEFAIIGKTEKSTKCLELAFSSMDIEVKSLFSDFGELMGELGSQADNLYVHALDPHYFNKLVESSPFEKDLWKRAMVHQRKLVEEGAMFNSLLENAHNFPSQSAMIIKGKYDYVMGEDQIYSYLRNRPDTKFSIFENSGHFPHFEEPEKFSKEVKKFILE